MASPIIGSISPLKGHSGGRNIVAITGANFRLPDAAPLTGVVPRPPPSVRVMFGTEEALRVDVAGEDLLYAVSPIHDVEVVDVTVANIDNDGVVVPGEETVALRAYEFIRPNLDAETDLTRCIRAFIRELKRQIHPNVSLTTHTDYDESTGDLLNIAHLASVPALVISGLEFQANNDTGSVVQTEVQLDADRFARYRSAEYVDAVMTLVGVTENPITLINLMNAIRGFFKKNAALRVHRTSDPNGGIIKYPLHFMTATAMGITAQLDGSNLASFSGEVRIVGIRVEAMAGLGETLGTIPEAYDHDELLEYGWIADVISMETQSK